MTEIELINFFKEIKEVEFIEKYKINLPSAIMKLNYDQKCLFKNYASFSFINSIYSKKPDIINYKCNIRYSNAFFEILHNSYNDKIPLKIELYCYWGKPKYYNVRYDENKCYIEENKKMILNSFEKNAIKVIKLMQSI